MYETSKPFHVCAPDMIHTIETGTPFTLGEIVQAAKALAGVTIPAQHQLIFLAFWDKLDEIFTDDTTEGTLVLNEICRVIKPYVAGLEQPKAIGFRNILKHFAGNTGDDSENGEPTILQSVLEALEDRVADFGHQHAGRRRQDPLTGPACATAKVGGMRGIPSPTDRVPGPGLGFNRGQQPEVAGEGGI